MGPSESGARLDQGRRFDPGCGFVRDAAVRAVLDELRNDADRGLLDAGCADSQTDRAMDPLDLVSGGADTLQAQNDFNSALAAPRNTAENQRERRPMAQNAHLFFERIEKNQSGSG